MGHRPTTELPLRARTGTEPVTGQEPPPTSDVHSRSSSLSDR